MAVIYTTGISVMAGIIVTTMMTTKLLDPINPDTVDGDLVSESQGEGGDVPEVFDELLHDIVLGEEAAG